MILKTDVSLRDLIGQILENYSAHTVLYYLAELEKHCEPEDFANHCNKLLNSGVDIE